MDDSITDRIAQLERYMWRGWAILPLHDVSSGVCSCRLGAQCRSAGKHPRREQWQRPEHLVRNTEQLGAALAAWPSCNWGVATGLISGVWALDFDPKSVRGGDPGQAALVAALLQAADAAGTWMQRTGSGGRHWLFTLPEDFVPNNSAKRLPDGFDVRGGRRGEAGGGQIVVAPSVSGVGPYAVLADVAPAAAPPLLLDLVRPAAVARTVAEAPLPPRPGTEGSAAAYVVAGISAKLRELRETYESRNNKAIEVAYRVVELANTGYVDYESARDQFFAAGYAHPNRSVIVPESELQSVWASAERHVGDRPADLSAVGGAAGWWGGDAIRPTPAPVAPLLGGGPTGAGTGGAGGSIPGGYPQGVPGAVDNLAGQHRTAPDSAGQSPDSGSVDPVAALLAEMLDVDQLRAIKPPQPLVNGVLDLDTTAWIIGTSGSYKSFVALDLAAHVGLGRPWRGHDVHQGDVVYIVAEGARGMRLRVDAWEREYETIKGVRFLPRPIQAHGGEWAVLVEACRRLRPALVVIDTQARVTLGLEENSNTDMGRYVACVDAIKAATGACVLSVHHTGRDGKDARGASALDGAQDAELKVMKKGQLLLELHMDKQKDQAEAPPVLIRLRRSEGGSDPDTGRDLSSLVVDHAVPVPMLSEGPVTAQETGRRRALALFMLIYDLLPNGGEGITRADIRKLFYALPGIAELSADARAKAWHRAWAFLLERGRVMRYGTSQRFAMLAPPDGGADGMITANTGGPEDAPPSPWSLMTVADDKALPRDV